MDTSKPNIARVYDYWLAASGVPLARSPILAEPVSRPAPCTAHWPG
jgi:hypothetical protein